MVVLEENRGGLKEMIGDLSGTCKIYSMKINVKKTKSKDIGRSGERLRLTLRTEKIVVNV